MSEQSRAGEKMLQNAEAALEMCRQVHRSTEEQKESGRFITASISSVTEMIRSIQQNTESHGAASEAVAEAVTRILEIARKSGERIPEVVSSLESLRAEARSLAGATGSASPPASLSDGGA
jgi:DNA repair ATPase RecN